MTGGFEDAFEWDEAKRRANIEKHQLDFRTVYQAFDGRPVLSSTVIVDSERRFVSVFELEAKFFTVIWTQRGDKRRIISFRRARNGEKRAYRELHEETA